MNSIVSRFIELQENYRGDLEVHCINIIGSNLCRLLFEPLRFSFDICVEICTVSNSLKTIIWHERWCYAITKLME